MMFIQIYNGYNIILLSQRCYYPHVYSARNLTYLNMYILNRNLWWYQYKQVCSHEQVSPLTPGRNFRMAKRVELHLPKQSENILVVGGALVVGTLPRDPGLSTGGRTDYSSKDVELITDADWSWRSHRPQSWSWEEHCSGGMKDDNDDLVLDNPKDSLLLVRKWFAFIGPTKLLWLFPKAPLTFALMKQTWS